MLVLMKARAILPTLILSSMVFAGCFFSQRSSPSASGSEWGCVDIPGTETGTYYKTKRKCWSDSKAITHAKVGGLEVLRVRSRSQQCVRGYSDSLVLHGRITDDATYMVKSLLKSIGREIPCTLLKSGRIARTSVYLSSDGGLLKDGFELGRLFRAHQVETRVTTNQRCASACATAFLGGGSRDMIGDSASLLFHAPYMTLASGDYEQRIIDCSDKQTRQKLWEYFLEMLDQETATRLFKKTMAYCSSTDGWTLNPDAARLFGLLN